MLKYLEGKDNSTIEKGLKVSRPTIYKYIDKELSLRYRKTLKDKFHSPKVPVVTEEAKAWVVHLSCTKPKEHG